jgi:hypothetical protein
MDELDFLLPEERGATYLPMIMRNYSRIPKDDLRGKRYKKLLILEYLNHSKWKALCDCGNERVVTTSALNAGLIGSCGCHRYKHTVSDKCIRCGVPLSVKNRHKDVRGYNSSTCAHCRRNASFCYYNYKDPKLEELSIKMSTVITNKAHRYRNIEDFRKRDREYSKKISANLTDNYVKVMLKRRGISEKDISDELIRVARAKIETERCLKQIKT